MKRGAALFYTALAAAALLGAGGCGGAGGGDSAPKKDRVKLGGYFKDLVSKKDNAAELEVSAQIIASELGVQIDKNTTVVDNDVAVQAKAPSSKFFAVYGSELYYICKDVTGKKQDSMVLSFSPINPDVPTSPTALSHITLFAKVNGKQYRLDNSDTNGNLATRGDALAGEYGVLKTTFTEPAPDVVPDNFRAIEVGAALEARDFTKLSTLLNLPTTIGSRTVDQIQSAPAGSKFFALDGNREVFYVQVDPAYDGRIRHHVALYFAPFSETKPDWALKEADLFARVRGKGATNYRSDDAALNAAVDAIGTTFDVKVQKATTPVPGLDLGDPDGIAFCDAYEGRDFAKMSQMLSLPTANKVLTDVGQIEYQDNGSYWAYNPAAPQELFFVTVSNNSKTYDHLIFTMGNDEAGNMIVDQIKGMSYTKGVAGQYPLADSAANGNLLTKGQNGAQLMGADFENQSPPVAMNFRKKAAAGVLGL